MHGDCKVSTKNLARADRLQVGRAVQAGGGAAPFRLPGRRHLAVRHRKAMPVYVEESILALDKIYINGGRRGYLVGIAPACWSTCWPGDRCMRAGRLTTYRRARPMVYIHAPACKTGR
jgi:hypothetical protein